MLLFGLDDYYFSFRVDHIHLVELKMKLIVIHLQEEQGGTGYCRIYIYIYDGKSTKLSDLDIFLLRMAVYVDMLQLYRVTPKNIRVY